MRTFCQWNFRKNGMFSVYQNSKELFGMLSYNISEQLLAGSQTWKCQMHLLDSPCLLKTVPFWLLPTKLDCRMRLPTIMSGHSQHYPECQQYKWCLATVNRKRVANQTRLPTPPRALRNLTRPRCCLCCLGVGER